MFFKKPINQFSIDDKLFEYYQGDKNHRFPDGVGIVEFNIETIKIETKISKNSTRHKVKYDGYHIGCNYYGWFEERFVAKTKRELAIKLVEQGIILKD